MDPAAHRPWQPLLVGAAAAHARRVVDELAAALREPPAALSCTLDGAAGRALFFAYLAAHRDDDAAAQAVADAQLDGAIEALAATDSYPTLWAGFVGTAWVAQHMRGRFAGADEDDDHEAIDRSVVERLAQGEWQGQYDLVSGLCGIGVYGLERVNRAVGRDLVAAVVARLAERAEARDGGITWHTPPRHLAEWARPAHPNGYYNCGVAHGVPAVIAVLAGACAAEIAVAEARPLLDGAVRWLARQADDGVLAYPCWIADGKRMPARLGWCYGDAGIAATLLAAGNAVEEAAWIEAALTLGRRAAALGRDEAAARRLAVHDSGLCHGSAGLALVFHRLWQQANEPVFADAARWWYGRVLADHRPGRGIGGYQMWAAPGNDERYDFADDDTLLSGATGVGLALLAGAGSIEPAWDRLLATSLPPR